jgi:Domain of unknown function (DUF4386)
MARAAGLAWMMVFVAGSVALSLGPGNSASSAINSVASLCYILVTVLLYPLLKPVNKSISLAAACFGLAGCAVSLLHLSRTIHIPDLVFFGLQCVLVGYLIMRSTFLPGILGALMVVAGLGWLTFGWPALASHLAPYNLIPGMVGEGCLLLWLIVKGVNVSKWQEQSALPGS